MIIKGKRALAYIVTIDEIVPLPGYDRVEYARTNGWWCVVKKDELHVGDKAVYFEVDSKVPDTDERFAFLAAKHYKIKTQKMCKVYSQGLLLPLTSFPELSKANVGDDVTEKLGVKYSVAEDNVRKSEPVPKDLNYRFKRAMVNHPNFAKRKIVRRLAKYKPFRVVVSALLSIGLPKDEDVRFPTYFPYIKKTDEERCENMPQVLGHPNSLIVTEKLDGTSCTYILERKNHNKYEFYVCSRNLRQKQKYQPGVDEKNIYWDLAIKYNIYDHLREYLDNHTNLEYVCVQGEGVGSVQGNPLKLSEDDLYIFNFIRSDVGMIDSITSKNIVEKMGMKFVPIVDENYMMPNDMESFKQYATASSVVNPAVLREGVVLRDPFTGLSFKNVSREYLMKHGM